jgi:PhzF family phenazine biosynthesis protein
VLDAADLTEPDMLAIAARAGHSETVFVTDGPAVAGRREYAVRYFSPEAEVPFCGHATIAVGAALACQIGPGNLAIHTGAGPVALHVRQDPSGAWTTTLSSPPPRSRPVAARTLAAALSTFGWDTGALDERVPPAEIYAGAWHLLIPVADRYVLAAMSYDFAALRQLSVTQGWVTVHVAHMLDARRHVIREPFPFGGVVEDPATGAAAAAYAAYLRHIGLIGAPVELELRQGEDMGTPCLIRVSVPDQRGPVLVTGSVSGLPTGELGGRWLNSCR